MTARTNDPQILAAITKVQREHFPHLSAKQAEKAIAGAFAKQSPTCRNDPNFLSLAIMEEPIFHDIGAVLKADPVTFAPVPSAAEVFEAEEAMRRAHGLQPLQGIDRLIRSRELAAATDDDRIAAKAAADAAIVAKGGTPVTPEPKPLSPALDSNARAEAEARANLTAAGISQPSGRQLSAHMNSLKGQYDVEDREQKLAGDLAFKVKAGTATVNDRLTLARLAQK